MSKRNENRPGYKKTRVGWIPEAWECMRLESLSEFITKGATPTTYGFSWADPNNGIPFLRSECVSENGFNGSGLNFISAEAHKALRRSEILPSDVLMTITGNVGRVIIFPNEYKKANINQHIARIRIRKTDIYYVYQRLCLGFYKKYYLTILTGQAYPQISLKQVRETPIPLPPLPEQKKIAEILSAWDRAIEQVGRLIDAKQRLKKGLMQQLLTCRMRFPEFNHETHEIHERKKGELPEGWKNKTLGSFGLFSKGKGISNSEKKETGFPCITYGEIYTRHEFVIKEFHSFIDKDTAQKSQRIQKGDIIFAGSGETLDEIGKCVVYTQDEEAYAGGDIIIFRPKGVDSVYLSYLLNSDLLIRQKRKLGQGYSVVHIYSSGLKILHVPLPSLPEQTRIAAAISTCDREIELLRRKEIALREQKKGLMQKLLTGEVRHPKFLKEGRA